MNYVGKLPNTNTPNGWYYIYCTYFAESMPDNRSNYETTETSILRILDNDVSVLSEDGELKFSYNMSMSPDFISGTYKLYRLTEEEIIKHVVLEHI